MPHTLMRLPYGEETVPVEAFDGPDKSVPSLAELEVGELISLVVGQD